eukprot:TRINITY_DN118533_c0_g1_i1.p1 TRINITY_DN118533_c0_g1~~TRINITY_DN118533_c0_g1_i1.p1  ORF type:complete len:218 (-),score=103.46 TRINITY_DN118533_c0_g1_i1:264-878(-)
MGISRDSRHKRRLTGGRRAIHIKKRAFEKGRPSAFTKLGTKRVAVIRVRGGNKKFRALRLDAGTFSWGTESISRKCRILDVIYNASNNELVRTKTLVKGAVVQIDAHPLLAAYRQHYGVYLGKAHTEDESESKVSKRQEKLHKARAKTRVLEQRLADQFKSGRVLARISSRPGQSGRADGYVLEGKELEFYQRKSQKKKGKSKQ